jgi:hypothetical protein
MECKTKRKEEIENEEVRKSKFVITAVEIKGI